MQEHEREAQLQQQMEVNAKAQQEAQYFAGTGGIPGNGALNQAQSTIGIGSTRRTEMLRRFDWAEDRIVRELTVLREARNQIMYADESTLRALEIIFKAEEALRRS